MGYDMRWRKVEADEKAAVDALRAEFYAACAVRDALPRSEAGTFRRGADDMDAHESFDARTERYAKAQDAVTAASHEVDEAENSYFRLNIFGMGRYRNLMESLGMAFEDDPHPPFPKLEDHGTTWEDIEAVEYPEDHVGYQWTDERLRAALGYKEAVEAVLAFHGKADTPGIPLHKFSSNDGWIVLPAEAEAAVRIWRDFVAREGEESPVNFVTNRLGERRADYWLKWIAYLAGAARHDGFEVH